MAQFNLSWESHKQNICSGLTVLQQNGEFVDMTLAADGHHVKVHKMVMSLASPYIKDIVANTQGLHPVLFLNKTSYKTLCALLEYIYTGEVMVTQDNLTELVEAGKELQISGLRDMKLEVSLDQPISQTMLVENNQGQPLSQTGYFDNQTETKQTRNKKYKLTQSSTDSTVHVTNMSHPDSDVQYDDDVTDHHDDYTDGEMNTSSSVVKLTKEKGFDTQIQYTISNQGALQMILNRFLYYLRYTSRKGAEGHRQWRCVDYVAREGRDKKCPAVVITSKDVVIKRFGAHNHPFHDQKILKKVRDNAVYSALTDAEKQGESLKQDRQRRTIEVVDSAPGRKSMPELK